MSPAPGEASAPAPGEPSSAERPRLPLPLVVWGACGGLAFALPAVALLQLCALATGIGVVSPGSLVLVAFLFAQGAAAGAAVCASRRASAQGRSLLAAGVLLVPLPVSLLAARQLSYAAALLERHDPAGVLAAVGARLGADPIALVAGLGLAATLLAPSPRGSARTRTAPARTTRGGYAPGGWS